MKIPLMTMLVLQVQYRVVQYTKIQVIIIELLFILYVLTGYIIFAFSFVDISDDMDNNQQNEIFEDKLSEAIEGMFEKSFQSRVSSFEFVVSALMKRFIPDIVNRRYLYFIFVVKLQYITLSSLRTS